MELFDQQRREALQRNEPLPARMRPTSLDQFVGQDELLGLGKPLRRLIESDRLGSDGDSHFDVTSAFIKSMRGSDPDATVYWLSRMLLSGEDPLFVARRIAICASEDVGNADPQAMILAASATQISQLVGMPECELALAQAAIYVACSPKSNAVAAGVAQAAKDLRERPTLPVPPHLRDSHYAAAARLGHSVEYQQPHDDPTGMVAQDYLGADRTYYRPSGRGEERRLGAYLDGFRRIRSSAMVPQA